MNCDWVKENIPLYLYQELGDDARHELEAHASRCGPCAAELAEMRRFHEEMSTLPDVEVTPNLLAAARMQLQEALETTEQVHGWRRLVFDPWAFMRQARFSPALAAIIFLVGFGGGVGATWRLAMNSLQANFQPEIHGEAVISGVRNITSPSQGQVQIQLERTLPETKAGSIDDPEIRSLLMMAARSNMSSGVRMDSLDLLRQKLDDPRVRESLVFSLRYDSNPGVRLKALEALAPYVKQDVRVRNAVLQALLDDNNPGVRTGALAAVEPVKADTSVRQALETLAKEDPNDYIRTESRRVLASVPEIY